jgi:rare lipoprotein A
MLLLPATSAQANGAEDSEGSYEMPIAFEPDFAAQFQPFLTEPPDLRIPDHAIDLTQFDPPLEDPVIRSLGFATASYYGRRFHGRLTANGERFDMGALTAAHRTLPFGTLVRVTNPRNGRSVTVRINDRGPFIAGREIDLSRAAAEEIGMIRSGHARVQLDVVAR